MEAKEATAFSAANPTQSAGCQECKSNSWKYKCPACFVRTCSLPCVKAHKGRSGCTGKRSLTHVVPLSCFDDNLLLSDYNMLEDIKRVAESAKRMRHKLCGYPRFRLPFPLKNLRQAATERRTRILFLSSGLSKRENNKTYYNKRENFISWTIEWRFNLTDIVLIDHGVHENTSICSVIENHLKPGPWNHPLRQFCEEPLDSLRFFIRKYPKVTKSPVFELDIKASLREQLANKVILEYPVIYVFLPLHSVDFEVINYSVPLRTEQNELDCDSRSPKGVTFREEDIEDGGSSDPRVLDLLNSTNLSSASKSSTKNKEINKLILTEHQGTNSFVNQHYNDDGKDIFDGTYSDLDFVDLFIKESDLGGDMDYSFLSEVLLVDEEQEEGEIAYKSSTEKETDKSVFPAGASSFKNGHFNEDDADICDDTYSDLDLVHSFFKEKDLGEKKDCSYLSEVLPVDEELEEGEIA